MKCDKLKMLQRKEKKMIEIKRAALYARFSSDNQRTESIDAQVRAMKDFCTQNKWKIVETYVDEAYSATNDRRPSFQRMIEDSGKGMFDIVLVHKLDTDSVATDTILRFIRISLNITVYACTVFLKDLMIRPNQLFLNQCLSQ